MRPICLKISAFGPFTGSTTIDFRELGAHKFFLIHGDTGAGKTTVFDAMTFALYGDTSGGARDGSQMRCQQSDPAVTTEVVFDFAVGAARYRIRRLPEHQRQALRGDGLVTQKALVELWDRNCTTTDAEEGTLLAKKSGEVLEKIHELLGFKVDQFRQVVLLPQGQFQKFLESGTDEREEVLRILFRTERFEKIEQALKDASGAADRAVGESRKEVTRILEEVGLTDVGSLEARITEDALTLQTAEELAPDLLKLRDEASRQLNAAKAVVVKLQEHTDATGAMEALKTSEAHWKDRRQELGAARKAEGVTTSEAVLTTARKLVETLGKAAVLLEKRRVDGSEVMKLLQKKQEKHAAEAPRRTALQDQIRVLEEQKGLAQTWSVQNKTAKEKQDISMGLQEDRKNLETKRQELEEELKGLDASMAEWARTSAQEPGLRQQVTNLERILELRKKLADQVSKLAGLAKSLGKAIKNEEGALGDLKQKRDTRNLLEAAWIGGQAARLAVTLADGSPCPVCGSSEHPTPAHGGMDVPTDESIEAARADVEAAENCYSEKQGLTLALKTDVDLAKRRVEDLEAELGPRAEDPLEKMDSELAAGNILLAAAQLAGRQYGEAGKKRTLHLAAQAKNKEALEALQPRLEEANGDTLTAQVLLGQTAEKLPLDRRDISKVVSLIRDTQATLQAELEAVKESDAKIHNLKEKLDELKGEARRLEGQTKDAQASVVDVLGKFTSALERAGFDEDAFRAAVRTAEAIAALESGIQDYDLRHAAATDRLERAQTAAEGLEPPSLVDLETLFGEAQGALDDHTSRVVEQRLRLESLQQKYARIDALTLAFADLDRRARTLGRLSEVASGKNQLRLSFHRYVLRGLLDQVLRAASKRLEPMTRGRYTLVRAAGVEDARSSGGLDLAVFDAHSGQTRPTVTLSGGEGFMASLSLALGLSDVVQSNAGGVKLDAVFVDEGFGSLSPVHLEEAIKTLKDLQMGGRLVGLISHLPELQVRIPAKLEIRGGRGGSSAAFRVP